MLFRSGNTVRRWFLVIGLLLVAIISAFVVFSITGVIDTPALVWNAAQSISWLKPHAATYSRGLDVEGWMDEQQREIDRQLAELRQSEEALQQLQTQLDQRSQLLDQREQNLNEVGADTRTESPAASASMASR